jgi:hypothetical protein
MKKFFTKLYILNFAIFITNCNLLYSQTPTGLTAVPSSIVSNVPEASSYGIVYQLDIPASNANYANNAISYALDNTSASSTNHTRVAYYMELDGDWVWVSMDDFASGNLTSLGIPKGSTNNVIWDQTVSNMNIYSNKSGITTGQNITTGNIEIWSQCYTQGANSSLSPTGSSATFDFDDTRQTSPDCHGSFQVHNYGVQQTLFGYNKFPANSEQELGIGNNPGSSGHPDWTFQQNSNSYNTRKLYIMVGNACSLTVNAGANQTVCAGGSVTLTGSGASSYAWDNGITDATPFTVPTNGNEWPPADGTLSAFTVTNSNKDVEWTVSGASYGNGTYKAKYSQGVQDAGRHPGKAFSKTTSEFHSSSQSTSGELDIEFPTAFVLGSYELRHRTANTSEGHAPKDWIVKGSNDGITWVDLDQRTGEVYNPHVQGFLASARNYTVSGNTTAYNHYRFDIGATETDAYFIIGELKYFAQLAPTQTYTVTGTDANGCTATDQVTLTINTVPDIDLGADITICGTTQSLDAGAGFASYLWSTGETTQTIDVTATGTYSVTVNNTNCNATSTDDILVTINPIPTVNAGANQTVCAGTNVTLTGSGAASYAWDNGVTNTTAFAANATTTYTVTGTDANSCTATDQVVITVNPLPTVDAGADQTVCAGTNVTLTGSGATSYAWDNGVTNGIAFAANATATYIVTGADANTCTATDQIVITVNALPTATTNATNATCNGSTDGSATVAASAGTSNYSYLWSDGQTTATATNLGAGNYSVTVTDANNCTVTQSIAILEPTALTATSTQTDAACNGDANGTATVTAAGGTGTLTYLWDDGQTTASATSLVAGTYNVTVTDANNCSTTESVTITEPTVLTSSVTSLDVSCNGSSDGSATVSSSGGTSSYSYLWDNGQTTATATSLGAGNYSVTVTDANNCTVTQSIAILEPTALIVSAGLDDTICTGGSVTLNGSGADTYIWDNNLVTDAIPFSPTATATYTVTGTDANGCSATDQVVVIVNALPTVDAGFDISVCTGGSVTLSGGGGVNNVWDNGVTNGTAFIPSATGSYTVTGTDANGCIGTDSVLVTVNQEYFNVLTIGVCTGDSVLAGGVYQTASGVFMDSLQSISGCDSIVETLLTVSSQIVANYPLHVCYGDSLLINGNYESISGTFYDTTLSVAGCDSITVTNFMVDSLITNSVMASVCFGDSLMVGGSYQTVSGVYVDTLITSAGCDSVVSTNFMIDSLIANSVMASICNGDSLLVGGAYQSAAGNYVDTLSTSSGCDSLVTTTLTVNTTLTSTDVQQAACDYTWIDGITYTTSDSLASYTLSSLAGCDSVVTLNLTISAIVTTIVQNVNDIEASATNGTAPYSYDWNTGETTASITPAVNGMYWVVVTDNDTCYSDTASFDVTFVSGTGIDNWNNSVSIYPNPTSDVVTIFTGNYTGSLRANVYDLFGRKVFTSNNKEISLKSFADGVYILEVVASDKTYTTKIIKE